jgi:hypothetical protein
MTSWSGSLTAFEAEEVDVSRRVEGRTGGGGGGGGGGGIDSWSDVGGSRVSYEETVLGSSRLSQAHGRLGIGG